VTAAASAPSCQQCGTALPEPDARCEACGLYQQLGPAVENPFTKPRALVTLFGSMAVVYGLTYLIVWAK
jgi:hypothetical protein